MNDDGASGPRSPNMTLLFESALIAEMNSTGFGLGLPFVPWRILDFPGGLIVCGIVEGPNAIQTCLAWVAALSMEELFSLRDDESREWGVSDGMWRVELIGSRTRLRVRVADRKHQGFPAGDVSGFIHWADVWHELGLS